MKRNINFDKIFFFIVLLLLFANCSKDEEEKALIFSNIRITRLPDKTTYKIGEEPDFNGLEVMNIFTDSSQTVNDSYKISYPTVFKVGICPVTVIARYRTATFNIYFTNDLIDTGFPVVHIETENQQPIDSKTSYVKGYITIKYKDDTLYQGNMQIRGRGNATWYSYPKKPYKIKLDENANLLNMGTEKDWVLLANYCDKTLMRNAISLRLSELMKFPWTPQYRFVELILNGEYLGNYNLTEHIEQDKNRVNIPSRGYIIERDGYYKQEPKWFETSVRKYGYSFKNPDNDNITEQEIAYINNYMNNFETVLFSSDFTDPEYGYKKYIDLYSFARWYVFQQILANMDTNVYVLKNDQDENSKLSMGPVWDFEWSIGIGWYEGVRPRPADYWVWNNSAFYFDRMLLDDEFVALVKSVWNENKHLAQEILNYFEELREELNESQKLNFRRWNIMNERVSVGGIPMGSFDKEVDCDILFFKNHVLWLDSNF